MRIRTAFLVCFLIGAAITGQAFTQDFHRDYHLFDSSHIRIRNIAGTIKVIGYEGTVVMVTACKTGRDRDEVEIVDESDADSIDIHVQYPEYGNHFAGVDFMIYAPQTVPFHYEDISSVSGDIVMTEIFGKMQAHSVSGRIRIEDVRGAVWADSVSGDVTVHILQAVGEGDMRLTSVSGDVRVQAPSDLDAVVDMSTISGMLWTDYPLRLSGRRFFIGRSARGCLGRGAIRLKISSISGRVFLISEH